MNYQRRIDENGRTYWVKYPEVGNDGQRYMRRYNQVTGEYEWEPYPEIPLDGKQYARQYNALTHKVEWVEVEVGGRLMRQLALALSIQRPNSIDSKSLSILWMATSSTSKMMNRRAIVQQCMLFIQMALVKRVRFLHDLWSSQCINESWHC